jgi:hypothetical protein
VLGGAVANAVRPALGGSLLERLRTRAALDEIESSRSWRALEWTARRRWLRPLAARLLDLPRRGEGFEAPEARLARIQASPAYRGIQAVKRSAAYRRWARRRWGSDWELARSAAPV